MVTADRQVRVFGFYGLVYRPSDRLCDRTIPLSGCMDRCSRVRECKLIYIINDVSGFVDPSRLKDGT